MANNPLRWHREAADIEALMELGGRQLDWARLQMYYQLFGLMEEFQRLEERFKHA